MRFSYRRSYEGPLQAVVLDWAGTTVDYGCCAPAAVFVEVFRRQGVEISTAEARAPMGTHKKVHIRELTQMPQVAARWQKAHGRPSSEEDVQAMFEEFVPLQCEAVSNYADLIPGTMETIEACRQRGLKIGSTTGYTSEMMEVVKREAKTHGYEPDCTVCADEVPAGRPEPWMCLENAKQLGVYPLKSVVKIGDTKPDVLEGLNAGMWTIAVAKTGNEMGLNEVEVADLPASDYERRLERARQCLAESGAHYVVDSIADVMTCLDDIGVRLTRGEHP